MSVVVTNLERGEAPAAVLTGDMLFIGDVGRSDLSESHTPQQLARLLYDSLREKILKLPDETLVYPAHGAGSMCGRNISADRSSTIGRERRTNYALQPMSPDAFVAMMTQVLRARPNISNRTSITTGAAPRRSQIFRRWPRFRLAMRRQGRPQARAFSIHARRIDFASGQLRARSRSD